MTALKTISLWRLLYKFTRALTTTAALTIWLWLLQPPTAQLQLYCMYFCGLASSVSAAIIQGSIKLPEVENNIYQHGKTTRMVSPVWLGLSAKKLLVSPFVQLEPLEAPQLKLQAGAHAVPYNGAQTQTINPYVLLLAYITYVLATPIFYHASRNDKAQNIFILKGVIWAILGAFPRPGTGERNLVVLLRSVPLYTSVAMVLSAACHALVRGLSGRFKSSTAGAAKSTMEGQLEKYADTEAAIEPDRPGV